ncbi:hypothetical protein BGW36DRAFT_23436 [Talaromyces proteolyticus]|uniref:Uncharacterized protein n=1 Tax=Talaromyces proteolyticus TaxID=1131652 RepID=A0AAD4PWL3_9EURO|nr:uncharacterized protein BGW36DRAFT_23436 [Talaromyces proteolyticus]KAH8692627.1 hypothetical protein BGW36DRAFT_23436 [Talaromyces proteolyticus]
MDLRIPDTIAFAEEVAVGFTQFRAHLPEYSAEITNLIANLYATSATLTSLEGLTRQFPRNYARIKPDLQLLLASLCYTLDEITTSFKKLDRKRLDSYRYVWLDLDSYFREESSYTLKRRLTRYKMFLQELEDMMQNKAPNAHFMAELRSSLTTLLSEQDGRLAARLAGFSIGRPDSSVSSSLDPGSPIEHHGPGKRRSYERARPGVGPSHFPPISPTSSSQGAAPPWVPEVPSSPTSTTTATTMSNLSSAVLNDHWARDIFADDTFSTPIPADGESSKCLGEDVEDIKEWLHTEGFDEVAYLSFNEDSSNLSVSFYVREDDNRARILCKVQRTRRSSKYCCLPLNMLEVRRVGSCLQFCRRRNSGTKLIPWLNLNFRTIEKMVTFFCTFLALRSQDSRRQVHNLRDYELHAEKEKFGGLIVDDSYLHALRIYKDRISGSIRLQASIHQGEMERAPVWTAFITPYIESSFWARRIGKRVVLRDLRRIILYPEYTPPRTSRGEHILKFTSEADAEDFIAVIDKLALTD